MDNKIQFVKCAQSNEPVPAIKPRVGTAGGIQGYLLEMKLLTHVMYQAKQTEQLCFHIASNVNSIGAFDDLVFISCTKPQSGFFLQAKCGKAMIDEDALFNKKGDFSLYKYLDSYRMIENAFEDFNVTCILYTTAGDKLNVNKKINAISSKPTVSKEQRLYDIDNLISIEVPSKSPTKFQLNKVQYLGRLTEMAAEYRLKNLAAELVKLSIDDSSAELEEIKAYEFILAEYVIDVQTKKIKKEFIDNNQKPWALLKEPMLASLQSKVLQEEESIRLLEAIVEEVSSETISKLILTDIKYNSDQERMELRRKFSVEHKDKLKAIKTFFNCKKVPKKTIDQAFELARKRQLESIKLTKLPDDFGKHDRSTSNNAERSAELAAKFVKVIEHVKGNKQIPMDQLVECFGGLDNITKLIGSLLVLDVKSKLFKFDLGSVTWKEFFEILKQKLEGLEQKLRGLEQKLKGLEQKLEGLEQKPEGLEQKLEGLEQKLVVQLDQIRFLDNVPGFPLVNDSDRKLAGQFIDKLWFYVNQADGDDLEKHLKFEIAQKYSNYDRNFFKLCFGADAILQNIYSKIQRWWINPKNDSTFGSGWLTKECEYFQEAKHELMKAPILNILDTWFSKCKHYSKLVEFSDDSLEVLKLKEPLVDTLNIITKNILLTSLKLRQYFAQKQDNCFFTTWSDVINNNLVKDIENELKNLNPCIVIIVKKEELLEFSSPYPFHTKCILVSEGPIKDVNSISDECRGLTDLTADSQDRILKSKTVNFQGEKVSLSHLIRTQELRKAIDSKTLEMLLAEEEIQIGKSLNDDIGYFIQRTFQRQTIFERHTLEKEDSGFLIVQSGDIDESKLKKNTDLVTISDDEEVFHVLSRKFTERNIHWFKEQDENLLWQKSNGHLSKLRDIASNLILDVDVQNDELGSVVMLAAEPGMGKSTMFSYLAKTVKQKTPTSWVANVCLREHSGLFLKWKTQPVTPIEAIHSILLRNGSEERLLGPALLEKEIFSYLWREKKIIIFLDGYDEISPNYEEEVFQVLTALKQHDIERSWIATRSNLQLELERRLNLFALSLKQFEKVDQTRFLEALWKKKDQTEDRLTNFCREILSRITSTIRDVKDRFVGIPLQLKMIALVFAQLCEEYCNSASKMTDEVLKSKLKENYNLIDLYKEFFRIKFVVVLNEEKEGVKSASVTMKQQLDTLLENATRNHRILAAVALLDKRFCKLFLSTQELSEAENLLQNISQEKTGIVYRVQDGQPVFVHQTFAEYFIVDYFWEKLTAKGHRKSELFMLTVILCEFIKYNKLEILRFFQQRATKELSRVKSPEGISSAIPRMCEIILTLHTWKAPMVLLEIVDSYISLMNNINTDPAPVFPWLMVDPTDYLFLFCVRNGLTNLIKCLDKTFDSWNVNALGRIFYEEPLAWTFDKPLGGKIAVLHVAADAGYLEMVEHFVAAGADIDVKCCRERTPLMYASRSGRLEIVEYLLKKSTYIVRTCDSEKLTALHYAAVAGHTQIVQKLLEAAKTEQDKPTCKMSDAPSCTTIERRIIDAENEYKNTALHMAAYNGRIEVMEELLTADLLINAVNSHGKTPLILSLEASHFNAAEYLLTKGADVAIADREGMTALHYAAAKGNVNLIEKLITAKTPVDGTDRRRPTPLMLSSKEGHRQAVDYLLGKNADVNAKALRQQTALHWAARNGHFEVVKILLNAGVQDKTGLVLLSKFYDVASLLTENQVNVDVIAVVNFAPLMKRTALHMAAYRGCVESIRNLVTAGANIDAVDENGKTALIILLENGFIQAANHLLTRNLDVNIADSQKQTPLHFATIKGLFEIVKVLVEEKDAQIDAADKYGRTALMLALDQDKHAVADYLLMKNADVNSTNAANETALYIVARKHRLDKIDKLLAKGASTSIDVITKYGETVVTCILAYFGQLPNTLLSKITDNVNSSKQIVLHFAAQKGCTDVIEKVFAQASVGALIDATNGSGQTALMLSLEAGHIGTAEYLLTKNPRIDIRCHYGRTALHYAAARGSIEMVEKLLNTGVQIDTTSTTGETALMLSLASNHLPLADYLLSRNARLDLVNSNGMTVLHYAAKSGHMTIVVKLVDAELDINATTGGGYTPLMLSLASNHLDVANYLLMHNARPDFVSSDGVTALHFVAKCGDMTIIEKLVDVKADVNATTSEGYTPLMFALQGGHLEAANYLLNNTSNIQAACPRGLNAFHLAAEKGFFAIAEGLVNAGIKIDSISNWAETPLLVALKNNCFDVAEFLLTKADNVDYLNSSIEFSGEEVSRICPPKILKMLTEKGVKLDVIYKNFTECLVRLLENGQHEDLDSILVAASHTHPIIKETESSSSSHLPLHIAAENGHIEVMKVLLAAYLQIDADTRSGKTALMLALQRGHLKAAECLLENGADVDALDSNRKVALHYAAEKGYSEIMDRLITTATSVDAFSRHRETALILSSKAGHVQTVEFLLGKNAKVNRMGSNRKTALHYAAEKGHLKIVQKLLTKEVADKTALVLLSRYFDVANLLREHQVDVNVRSSENQTALHYAASRGHVDSIRNLVAAGANINTTDEDGQTALMILLDKGFLDAANYLMMENVDVKVADSHGQTPLHFAAKKGLFEIFETLVDKGAEIDAADKNGKTALMLSLDRGFFDAADVLLENGASVSAVDSDKCTALHIAARKGFVNSIEKLLKKEAPIDAVTDYGKTALMLSIERGIRKAVHVLLDANADVNIEDSLKKTALHYAADEGFHDCIVRMVEAGALVDAATTNGEAARLLWSLKDHFNIAEYLLEKNAGIDAKNSDGRTALHYAAENGCVTIIEKLLKAEAQINATTTKNQTALMLALASNHLDVADTLLKHDARLDFVASNGMTMLHYAAKSGHMSTIKKLVDAGADVYATTSEGYTPLMLSLDANHLDVAHCLLMHDVRLDFVSSDKMTMLHYAAESGHMPTIKKLVDAGADFNATAGTGDTPLMLSLQSRQLEAAKYFVDKTTNIQAVNPRGLNALHFAAEQGYLPIVKKLVNRGMKVNNISKVCGTPFHLALKRNFFDVAEYLLMQTENADYLNSVVGCFEVTEKCPPKILQQLVEKGVIIDVIYKNCTDYLVQLLQNGQHADVDSILNAAALKALHSYLVKTTRGSS
ncbi:uncharacterized protein LOC128736832 [Sabethes cyaneus]|uniref:uncharacterized protein LOC128736832 n=1 Tax=Sabethes cyaneus TaxID=53552 RepID=UPI00237E982A|nr:uncharacterized protein LOC128736832 [Sabethes cyaneus]